MIPAKICTKFSPLSDPKAKNALKHYYLTKENINFMDNKSHIVPVMVHDPIKCKEISNILLDEFGHYIQPINYPTVPMGTERLRITPGPLHTEEMIANLTNALKYAFIKANSTDNIKSA